LKEFHYKQAVAPSFNAYSRYLPIRPTDSSLHQVNEQANIQNALFLTAQYRIRPWHPLVSQQTAIADTRRSIHSMDSKYR